MKKRGQATLFIIVAVVIVVAIVSVFLFRINPDISVRDDVENIKQFIDSCVKDETNALIDLVLPTAGFLNNQDYILYNGQNIPYLCKNINYYDPCVNQHPRFIFEIQEGLNNEIGEKVGDCFSLLEEELEARNYNINAGDIYVNTELKTGLIEIQIERKFDVTKGDFSQSFEIFQVFVNRPLYDIAYVANEISAQEAEYCYFNTEGYMTLYNRFDIKKDVLSDSTKIYSVRDKQSGDEMNIAVRGCAIPYGI